MAMAGRHRTSRAAASSRTVDDSTRNTAQHLLQQPNLADDDDISDPDRPLVPRAETTTSGRVARQQVVSRKNKMQRLKSLEQRRAHLSFAAAHKPAESPDDEEDDTLLSRSFSPQKQRPDNSLRFLMQSADDEEDDDDAQEEKKSSHQSPQQQRPQQLSSMVVAQSYSSSSTGYYNDSTTVGEGEASPRHQFGRPMMVSSSYATNSQLLQDPTRSGLSASIMTPEVDAFFNERRMSPRQYQNHAHHHQQQQHHHATTQQQQQQQQLPQTRRIDDDDTYDYGRVQDDDDDYDVFAADDDEEDDDDNNSNFSLSYQQRRRKQEQAARQAAAAKARAEMNMGPVVVGGGPFVQSDDVEHYRKSMDTPVTRTALVVASAAAVGCVVLGPVGLLVGAAAVGLTVGAMQIPKEQRDNMISSAHDSALKAGDAMSTTCVNTYRDSGISEHVPEDMQNCCAGLAAEGGDGGGGGGEAVLPNGVPNENGSVLANPEKRDEGREQHKNFGEEQRRGESTLPRGGAKSTPPGGHGRDRRNKGKAACLRQGMIVALL